MNVAKSQLDELAANDEKRKEVELKDKIVKLIKDKIAEDATRTRKIFRLCPFPKEKVSSSMVFYYI
ncbi:MAG: hypothetical protein ACREOZ_02055 [Gloeomargaritales cyanobacterium]